jgi:hypothetical protein
VLQIRIELNATSGRAGADNAVTNSADIVGTLLVEAAKQNISASLPTVSVILVCGDGKCQAGEEVYAASASVANLPTSCLADCPVTIGNCPAPNEGEAGDPTVACGGNGYCRWLELTCACAAVRCRPPWHHPAAAACCCLTGSCATPHAHHCLPSQHVRHVTEASIPLSCGLKAELRI